MSMNVLQGKPVEENVAYLATAKNSTFSYTQDFDIESLLQACQYKAVWWDQKSYGK